MKKYFKIGISILIPIALVYAVFNWLYGLVNNIVIMLLPSSLTYQWWYVFPLIIATMIVIYFIGVIFSLIKPFHWLKVKIEDNIIYRIPVVNKIYNFGVEISDSFITDIKEDGELQVIEISFGEFKLLGVLTDEENNIGFLISAPSPLTGVVIKLPNYRKLDMSFMEAVKINTSLGKIGGENWK